MSEKSLQERVDNANNSKSWPIDLKLINDLNEARLAGLEKEYAEALKFLDSLERNERFGAVRLYRELDVKPSIGDAIIIRFIKSSAIRVFPTETTTYARAAKQKND